MSSFYIKFRKQITFSLIDAAKVTLIPQISPNSTMVSHKKDVFTLFCPHDESVAMRNQNAPHTCETHLVAVKVAGLRIELRTSGL